MPTPTTAPVKPEPTAWELQQAAHWMAERLQPDAATLPFSFMVGGKRSGELLTHWVRSDERCDLDQNRTRQTLTWRDGKSGLEVRCVAAAYADYPAIEWTLYFRNTGQEDTPLLEDIQPLDIRLDSTLFSSERSAPDEFILHGTKGDWCNADAFQPFSETLEPNSSKRFAPYGGRPTNAAFPYYNLQMPGGGILLAVGWPGQWAATFQRDATDGLRIVAGQELTHLHLKPGEEIRTPLIAMLFWRGTDTVAAQNLWRRWMLAHNLPRTADGQLPPPQIVACSSHQFKEMTQANEENQKLFVSRYLAEGMKLDYWWMDAGWYPCDGAWQNTGTWEPDAARFPNGLAAVSDHAHSQGVNVILWFEPERIGGADSWIVRNHPEWLLSRRERTREAPKGGNFGNQPGSLFNLGNPDALAWLINHVDRTLREQGIDFYRQDFNMDPLGFWLAADSPDRQGMTENLYVQGYLAYWDALRQRHPGMLIDSCASGGRRDDLETLRRALPLIRSDYLFEPTSQQCHHFSFASWIPYHGAGYVTGPSAIGQHGKPEIDPYYFRSDMSPSLTLCYDMRSKDLNYKLARRLFAQLRRVGPSFLGDFYPLTPYTLAKEDWLAWQYDRPDAGEGMVQAFRRQESAETSKVFRLSGLDRTAQYDVADLDVGIPTKVSGEELMDKGLTLEITSKPGAAVIVYRRAS